MELCVGKGFCQSLHNHLRGGNILKIDLLSSHFVILVVMLNINIPCSNVIDKIMSESNEFLIVSFARDGNIF